MLSRSSIYLFLFGLLFFAACRKDDLQTDYDYKTLGRSSRDLLASNLYSSLQIEVSYMPGHEPGSAALDSLAVFLQQYLNKPDGIHFVTHAIPASGKPSLDLFDLVKIEKGNRNIFTKSNTLSVHVLIVDADYLQDENLLGISYWNTSFCLFGEKINERSGGAGQVTRSKLYSILLQHEFGHLLGLVGQGSPMQHAHHDSGNGAHCKNPSCLMYYRIETGDNLNGSSAMPKLDGDCKADLKANGGK